MADVVNEDDFVVLMKSFDSGNIKIVKVQQNSTVHYGKLHFDPSPLAGAQYGTVFEIRQGTMIKVDNFEMFDNELSDLMSRQMTTFKDKTKFSQEKIIKKKKRKSHANVVTVIRPTLLLVNEMLFARDKIGGLRADILAQMLTLSNVQCGSRCLVLDHNLGIVTSAIMSRILPLGVCIQLLQDYEVIQTTRKTMELLNIKETDCVNNLYSITIRDLYKVLKGIDSFQNEGDILQRRNLAHLDRLSQMREEQEELLESAKKIKKDESSETKESKATIEQLQQNLLKKESNRALRQRERVEAAKLLKTNLLDSILIVVQNDHPLPILKMLYQFLAPSRQFVIYSDTVGPLLECYQYLKTNSQAVSLNVSESWFRKYQVLPDRTRPEMNASGYGGYLLSGTKALYDTVATTCDV